MTFCPTFDSWEEFRARRFQEPLWRPLIHEVLARHDIERPKRVAMASSVHVVAIIGPVVVKLYQPLSENDAWAVESAAIPLLSRHGLPVPELLAAGVLFPDAHRLPWPYCVMSPLAGRPLDDSRSRPRTGSASRPSWATSNGECIGSKSNSRLLLLRWAKSSRAARASGLIG